MLVECSCSARMVTKREFPLFGAHTRSSNIGYRQGYAPPTRERHRHYPASETTEAWHTYNSCFPICELWSKEHSLKTHTYISRGGAPNSHRSTNFRCCHTSHLWMRVDYHGLQAYSLLPFRRPCSEKVVVARWCLRSLQNYQVTEGWLSPSVNCDRASAEGNENRQHLPFCHVC